jgi:hypothetical protein
MVSFDERLHRLNQVGSSVKEMQGNVQNRDGRFFGDPGSEYLGKGGLS